MRRGERAQRRVVGGWEAPGGALRLDLQRELGPWLEKPAEDKGTSAGFHRIEFQKVP